MNKVYAVYISPTGGTRGLSRFLAGELAKRWELPLEELDLSLPVARLSLHRFSEDSFVVLGCPTYAGRIPNKFLPELETKLAGSGKTRCAILSVYGGRSNGDALRELILLAERIGFLPVAAAACMARHSMSDLMGAGRPDARDLEQLRDFAGQIADKAAAAFAPLAIDRESPIEPYYRPLREDGEPASFLKAKPVTDAAQCDRCGLCVSHCPMGSIRPEDPTAVDGLCIKCHACVHICPRQAKRFDNEDLLSHVRSLEKVCTQHLENVYLL